MKDDFTSAKPIYLQLMERVCAEIVRGDRASGDKLPSVRDMAVQAGVNPNTVQRVYTELEQRGIAETRRGQGTFVTEDVGRLQTLRDEMLQERIETFVMDMRDMGMHDNDIFRGIQTYIDNSQRSKEES